MAQPIKKSVGKKPIKRKKQTTRAARVREIRKRMKGSQEFGTSKLEERFAKNFLDKYNDIALLADLMGHESIETTRIYLRKTASEQQAIVDKIVTR